MKVTHNYVNAPFKSKMKRALYLMIVGLMAPITVPTMVIAACCDGFIFKLQDWLLYDEV